MWLLIGLGALLACSIRALKHHAIATWLCIFAAHGVAIAALHSWTLLAIHGSALLVFCVLEKRRPRFRQDADTAELLWSASHFMLRRACGPALMLAIAALGLEVRPWGWSCREWPTWAQACIALVVLDGKQYWLHRWRHRFAWWWKLHRVHHFNTRLSAIAYARTHLGDFLIGSVLSAYVLAAILGISAAAVLYGYSLPGALIAGLAAHSNLDFPRAKIPFWAYVVSTPNVHALHHHRDHMDRNYGDILVIWDVLFGTWKSPLLVLDNRFGVRGEAAPASMVREQLLGFQTVLD